ncbi:alpha/beta fold hydrolase [Micromonospora sonneratiae]|uniref:Thioesterase II family protein n=1 Tax=Micromonospora sonneratiae TaxID=1184706 RepID=A0ABW3YNE5_9ACTN
MSPNLVRLSEPGTTAVYLFPFAGASASSYWSWAELLPPGFEVSAVQLPGRQDRWQDPPYQQFADLVDDLADDIAAAAAGRPTVLVGHSMGAAIGYEVARQLQARAVATPALLAVSAAIAPHVAHDNMAVRQLSDPELIELAGQGGWLPTTVLQTPELLELVLPMLRADLELIDDYRYIPGLRLTCPISVLGGRQDPLVPTAALESWRELTEHRATVRTFDGGHHYLWDHEHEVASALLADLAAAEGTPR